MGRITRYVLAELTKVFLVTLTVMTLLVILFGVAQEAIREGLGVTAIIRLVPYILPIALRFAVPGTILFAACSVYGRMSADNEVMAIKSLGISPMVVIAPALILAFVVSLLTVWLNDIAVSWGRRGMDRVVLHSIEQIVYRMLETNRSYSTNRFSIIVERVDGRHLVLPVLTFNAADDAPAITLTASRAELRFNADDNTLDVIMDNSEGDYGSARFEFPDRSQHKIPLSIASRKGGLSSRPSDCALRQIPDAVRSQRSEIERLEQSMAAEAAYQMMTGDFDGLLDDQWNRHNDELSQARDRLYRLYTEPWRRWATGFSCFFFVMVGAPLAVRLRNADVWTSFGLCFLPILIVYYPLLMYGVERAKGGELPPYSVWLGNVVLSVAGAWLLRGVVRR